jgi:hypothetical protein
MADSAGFGPGGSDRSRPPAGFLLRASLILLVAGVSLQVVELVSGGWPTLIPLMLIAYSLPFLSLSLWARWRARRPDWPWLVRHASVVGISLMLGGIVVNQVATGVRQRVVVPMTWSIQEEGSWDEAEVVLRFRDAPDHRVGLVSDELAAYLRGRGQSEVQVEFETVRDYGRLRSYNIMGIGDLGRPRSQWGYSGCSGSCSGSPF